MASILSRLADIEKQLEHEGAGKISVTFKDGTRRLMDGGACVDLVLNSPDTVVRFERVGDGCGALPDLLGGLLAI